MGGVGLLNRLLSTLSVKESVITMGRRRIEGAAQQDYNLIPKLTLGILFRVFSPAKPGHFKELFSTKRD